MKITDTQQETLTLVAIEGRLDAAGAVEADKHFSDLIAGGARRLVVDGSKLDYISSAGLRVLLSATKRMQAVQGRLVLGALQSQVREIVELAGFTAIIPVWATLGEARQACAK